MYSFFFSLIGESIISFTQVKLKSKKFILWSGSFDGGSIISFTWVNLTYVSLCFLCAMVFHYIFLLVDHFEWALIDGICMQRADSFLWQFYMWWRISPVIFLSTDCFKWALIDGIDMQRACSFLSQFQMGGGHQPKYVHLPNLSSLFQVLLFLHRALLFLIRNKRPTRCQLECEIDILDH